MKNRGTTAVILYSVIQLLLLTLYFYKTFSTSGALFIVMSDYEFNIFLGILIMLLNLMGIYMIRKTLSSIKKETEYKIQKLNLDNIIRLNNAQRSQRHDFLNHLHVIYNLIEIQSFDRVKNYIEKIYMDVQETAVTVGSGLLEVDALLQSKISFAKGKGIKLEVEVTKSISNISIEPWQLIRILGNIIDNAIDACVEAKKEGQAIEIIFDKDSTYHKITVKNTGIPIARENINKIFDADYTTKGEGHGLGLYISNNIIKAVEGYIKVQSDENLTLFEICIPPKPSSVLVEN